MAFLNVLFPEHISYGSKGGQTWSTHVTRVGSGHEYRNQNWYYPLWRMDVSFGIKDYADLMALKEFFNRTRGRAHSFRFLNPLDHTSSGGGSIYEETVTALDEPLVMLTSTTYQLVRTYTDVRVNVTLPRSDTVRIAVGGNPVTTGWSVDYTTGIVTFAAAPGGAVTGGFWYDTPMRFDTDDIDIRFEDLRLLSASVPVVEVRR